ncbi:MAG: ComEC/Rec2 family competence protein, partial [Caulobacteraceae bacterium]|nr:ComEC/Rec2 family competence protein [Caulobacter sp.]
LVTGQQAWLDPSDVQAMRDSGLAHILSISGVHMAIVGGFAFALARLLIAAWPWAALRVSGKKVAAGVGLAALVGYLFLAGAPAPAIRSALTAGIAFTAVMLDRRALTLHSLAVAALLILLLQPEAVAQPGFEMSFAATAALLALAEAWPHAAPRKEWPWARRLALRGRDWLVAGAAVSLVAGLATDPFGIQHFNRVTLWGLPANVATELLSSLMIMPALALGVAGEAVGWSGPPLSVAGWGLEAMTAVARLFAAAPHAVMEVPSAPALALPVSFCGLLLICLWRGSLRWLGAPLFLAVWAWPRPPAPDLWIAPDGANFAVSATVAGRREAVLARPRSQRFAFELWAKRRGLTFPPAGDDAQASADALFACARSACTPAAPGAAVASWYGLKPPPPERVDALCASAPLVILRTGLMPPLTQAPACRGRVVLDATDLARGGAAELWRAPGGGWRVGWAQDLRGDRPWTAGGGVSDSGG